MSTIQLEPLQTEQTRDWLERRRNRVKLALIVALGVAVISLQLMFLLRDSNQAKAALKAAHKNWLARATATQDAIQTKAAAPRR